MKVGVLLAAYNSEEYIDDCLTPWFNLKDKLDITIGCTSGMFSDYRKFGFKPQNRETLNKLLNYDLDFLLTTGNNGFFNEDTSRNNILNLLKNKCDVIWILDADEIYTENQILGIVRYVQSHPECDWFRINFKNYVFNKDTFINGYNPPRIFRTDRYGGIDKFYFDNHIQYNNGEKFDNKIKGTVPRNIAWVTHYTWLDDDPKVPEKVKYQNHRFANGCAYGYENGKLVFSKSFYNKINLELPITHKVIDKFSSDFTINYVRSNQCFYVNDITLRQSLEFNIFDGDTSKHISKANLTVDPTSNGYYISPMKVDKPPTKYRIEVKNNGKIIHHQFLYAL